MSERLIKEIDCKGITLSIIRKPRAYSEVNRPFKIERKNKILLYNLIHVRNRTKKFGWSEGLNGKWGDWWMLYG